MYICIYTYTPCTRLSVDIISCVFFVGGFMLPTWVPQSELHQVLER